MSCPGAPSSQRCHEEALYAAGDAAGPALLSPAQARLLWEEAVRANPGQRLLAVGATAALAARAWDLAHAWRIEGALEDEGAGEDARAFAEWCAHYRRRTRRDNLVDAARLPALLAARYASGSARPPATLVAYGFDLLTPQQQDFLAASTRAGANVVRCAAPRWPRACERTSFESPRQELEHAARWARQRLEVAHGGSRAAHRRRGPAPGRAACRGGAHLRAHAGRGRRQRTALQRLPRRGALGVSAGRCGPRRDRARRGAARLRARERAAALAVHRRRRGRGGGARPAGRGAAQDRTGHALGESPAHAAARGRAQVGRGMPADGRAAGPVDRGRGCTRRARRPTTGRAATPRSSMPRAFPATACSIPPSSRRSRNGARRSPSSPPWARSRRRGARPRPARPSCVCAPTPYSSPHRARRRCRCWASSSRPASRSTTFG